MKTDEKAAFYPGFERLELEAGGVRFAGVRGGSGPPVLLLHGFPQTHVAWRKIGPALADQYSVVIPDLPGYGASRPDTMQPRWTKRRVAKALMVLMQACGHQRFAVVGHDRGARVGFRLALDYPEAVAGYMSLAVVPTVDAIAAIDARFAAKNFHWFLLAQSADLPERLLAADPDAFLDRILASMEGSLDRVEPTALEAYRRAFRDPAVRHAMCEDYRAALDEDLALDTIDRAQGRKLSCPVRVLWPAAEASARHPTPVETWSTWADDVSGTSTSGGHLQPEDAPSEVLSSLMPFLRNSLMSDPE